MIVFDIESGRLEAPGFHHCGRHLAQPAADVVRPNMPLSALRLMTLAEAVWIESRQDRTVSSRIM